MRSYGAEVHICPNKHEHNDPDGYVALAQRFAQTIPGAFMPNQYFNLSNPKAHYSVTGPEIWEQTGGRITHFVAAGGTGGTVSGVGKFLKEKKSENKNNCCRCRYFISFN